MVEALEDGARNTLLVAMACACAGIVIGCVTLTGLGISFTQVVVGLAREMLPLALLLTAIAGIVLGMGMPTTPAYIVMVSLLVPALIKLGAIAPAAHMFAFYFAILSAITPPVALAVFAAASLGKTDLWKSGWEAVRIGAAGFIVPFMFVYEPAILMVGDWQDIALFVHHRHDRHHSSCRFTAGLPDPIGSDVAAGGPVRCCALPDQTWLENRPCRPGAMGVRVCLAIFCQKEKNR